jgi:hypothetical protein
VKDLIEFLRALLDEDEQIARAATGGPWHVDGRSVMHSGPPTSASSEQWGRTIVADVGAYDGNRPTQADAAHIARWDPTRALAEVALKRQMLEGHEQNVHRCEWGDHVIGDQCVVQRRIAAVYADRAGFKPEWRL